MSPNQPLPQKENAVFKKILRSYEHKQYKNGLKLAKVILSNPKFAEHGETLAMKGLILNCLRKKEEAYEHIKRGLKSDVKSHVCWHVFGLLQRSDRKYDEAIRAYRNALKCDPDNIQILRDLSLLQIQMRDLEGYHETRHKLFTLRPTQKASWIGFAMSYHLLDDYEMAVKLIDEFLKIQKKTGYDYEQSELLLYQIQIVFESGNYQEVLYRIDKNEGLICDKLSLMETRAEVYLRLGRFREAEDIYDALIKRNQENKLYYYGLIKARQLQSDEDKVKMFEEFKCAYPRAHTPHRLPLNMSSGVTFKSLVDEYMRHATRKGVPPLFVDLKPLYGDPEKAAILHELVEMYLVNLKYHNTFDGPEGRKEPITAYVWAMYYACQHFDLRGDSKRALQIIDEAIEHTPTLIELYLAKAKVFKHSGNMARAVQCLDKAQSLDTADRYINSKCAKYMLRACRISEAESMCAKFTRENVSAMENLNEMQCMWFQTECADAYERLRKPGEALRKCHEVDRHFVEITEDQFDFHTYCMRKMTLRSYIGLLRLEDVVRSHPFYFRAARIAIQTYLKLHDNPLGHKKAEQDELESTLSKSELKKLRNKQRKAMEKLRMEEKENKDKDKKAPSTEEDKVDDGLSPDKLERPTNALDEAIRFLRPLQDLTPNNIDTHLLSYEIFRRRDKPLLMLQSLVRAHRLQPDHPTLHGCLAHFLSTVVVNKELSSPVKAVIEKQVFSLFGTTRTAKELNDTFFQMHKVSYPHAIAAARVMYELDKSRQQDALEWVTLKREDVKLGIERVRCEKVLQMLAEGGLGPVDAALIESFREECARRFPLAEAFMTDPPVLSAPAVGPDAETNVEWPASLLPQNRKELGSTKENDDK
ncbi:N-alpha-acetyltransferase 15 [Tropilaelaps mercedesae]|uniref:N-alpha-acetyltransferase 15 n=1 Tax=Tropilaelaps mercedesae TaxID=418985 RepID=A0A1V9XGI3_9ACAR|nr:N-alpha-acetyltransferase 15 [Tropilaelaps mercedesae]